MERSGGVIARGIAVCLHSDLSMAIAALFAAFIEIMTIIRRKPFPLSSVSIGLGVILPPDIALRCVRRALLLVAGASAGARHSGTSPLGGRARADLRRLITGAALVGVADALIDALVF